MWHVVPLLIVIFLITVNVIQPEYGTGHVQEYSTVNQVGLGSAYLVAFILVLFKFFQLKGVLLRAWPYGLLLLFILSSSLWSLYPQKVVISFVHQVGMSLSVLCAVLYAKNNPDKFIKILVSYFLLYMMLTIVYVLKNPALGHMDGGYWGASQAARWKGLTGHANSLGQVTILGVWCSLYGFLRKDADMFWRMGSLICLLLSLYVLYKTDSITSLVICLFLIGMFIFYIFNTRLAATSVFKYILFILLTIICFASLYILAPEAFSLNYLLEKVGRSKTMTGRTELWELGFKGFQQKPFLGWSFDALRSFLKQYNLGYGQLHNGYIDLLVRGGLVGVILYVVILFQVLIAYTHRQVRKFDIFVVWFFVWVLATLIYALSEGVLVRSNNLMWLLFLFSYYYIIFPVPGNKKIMSHKPVGKNLLLQKNRTHQANRC